MAYDPISEPRPRRIAHPSRPVFLYALLACLFAIAIPYQIAAAWILLHYIPTDIPEFVPATASSTLKYVDSKAVAAGLHQGDSLLAINGYPYTGTAVFFDEILTAVPGSTLNVTVRSAANSQEHTIRFPVKRGTRWIESKPVLILLVVVVPALCIVLGFWVVLVRPNDISAWLLLGVLLGFTQLANSGPEFGRWGTGILQLAVVYNETLKSAWPIFMFLFAFYFPEPLPSFQRPHSWRKWLPWIVIVPYVLLELPDIVIAVGQLTSYSSVEPLYRALNPLRVVMLAYPYCLVGAFFALIFSKSSIAISPDSKRRLRLLYWGATIAMTPGLLIIVLLWLTHVSEPPDWLAFFVLLMFLLFPFTLAYVIVLQRAMDVRVVVRQGLQYGLAKNGIRTLQVIAIFICVVVTGLLLRQNRSREQVITVIAVEILAVFAVRRLTRRLGAWTDCRFFREAYDAEQVLSELSDDVHSMVETRSLIETVAGRLSETLHIPRVAVLLGYAGSYRPAYALGYGAAPDITFPLGAGTVKVLQRQKGPARVYFDDPNSWLYRKPEITDEDRSKLTQLDSELLLPLSTREKLMGFISLGPKLSEEPYSRTDLRLLKSIATQTGLALENADLISVIADEVAQRERLHQEVEIARQVQERLFPQKLPPIAGIEYAGACRPASGVGGDYYDFLAVPTDKLGIALGDVSGKGIAAALMMASLQASLRSEATRSPDDLAGMMSSVNRLVYEVSSSSRYATFFYGQYDPALRQLTYVNAGHNPPMLFHYSGSQWQVCRLETGGTVVGLLESVHYQQGSVRILPGDILMAFTDGISEAMNNAQDEFGEERMIETVKEYVGQNPMEIITCIMQSADAFVAGAKQNDDMTLVVLCAQLETVK
jgi:phosphoserine phosphatase RsbU/P